MISFWNYYLPCHTYKYSGVIIRIKGLTETLLFKKMSCDTARLFLVAVIGTNVLFSNRPQKFHSFFALLFFFS